MALSKATTPEVAEPVPGQPQHPTRCSAGRRRPLALAGARGGIPAVPVGGEEDALAGVAGDPPRPLHAGEPVAPAAGDPDRLAVVDGRLEVGPGAGGVVAVDGDRLVAGQVQGEGQVLAGGVEAAGDGVAALVAAEERQQVADALEDAVVGENPAIRVPSWLRSTASR